jgi:hypothetical protein
VLKHNKGNYLLNMVLEHMIILSGGVTARPQLNKSQAPGHYGAQIFESYK